MQSEVLLRDSAATSNAAHGPNDPVPATQSVAFACATDRIDIERGRAFSKAMAEPMALVGRAGVRATPAAMSRGPAG